jgi:hypothetical protein
MKLLARALILSLCIILLSACTAAGNDRQINSEKPISEENTSNITSAADFSNYAGVYKYDYEYDTEDLAEDHYIVLELADDKLLGRYYGTSDDFDEAREGYYPGFYVSDMNALAVKGSNISFSIKPDEGDMFSKPVQLEYRSSKEIPKDENPVWVNSHIIGEASSSERHFEGEIIDGEIRLLMSDGTRVFKRVGKYNGCEHRTVSGFA